MKYMGMPLGMWALFAGSFKKQLGVVFGYDEAAAKEITDKAKPTYKEIITGLPEFEKADRFTERQKEKEVQAAKTEKVGKEQPDQKPKTKKHDMEL